MIYTLTYELKSVDRDYASLFNFLEHGTDFRCIHVLRDCWWIASDEEIEIDVFCNRIRKLIGEKDHFFFARLFDSNIDGWMPSSTWDFFRQHV